MDYVKLGRTGLDVSRICLGCMSYGGGNRPRSDQHQECSTTDNHGYRRLGGAG
jgi:aryl-alcohol dehydrogenase-like predicted oxidoreductase